MDIPKHREKAGVKLPEGRYIIKEDETGCLKQDWVLGGTQVVFHLDAYKWSASIYKEWRGIFDKELDLLRDLGYKVAWSCVKESDAKALKFNKMFGFEPAHTFEGRIYLIRKLQ